MKLNCTLTFQWNIVLLILANFFFTHLLAIYESVISPWSVWLCCDSVSLISPWSMWLHCDSLRVISPWSVWLHCDSLSVISPWSMWLHCGSLSAISPDLWNYIVAFYYLDLPVFPGFGSVGTFLEGPIIGLISAHYGWSGMFYLMIGLSVVGALAVLRALSIYNQRQTSKISLEMEDIA